MLVSGTTSAPAVSTERRAETTTAGDNASGTTATVAAVAATAIVTPIRAQTINYFKATTPFPCPAPDVRPTDCY